MTPLVLPIAALAIAHGIAERERAQPHRPRFPIRQVIFVVKENRTFDNYFGKFPGADGATSGRISDGTVIPLGPLPNGPQGGSHSWDAALLAYHDGKMDRFDLIPGSMGGELNMVQASEEDIPNGDGSFQAPQNFGTGSQPSFLAIGDFNSDGLLDLAVANSNSSSASVLLGNGDGSFQPWLNLAAGRAPVSVAVGDFNRDGWQDLVVANQDSNDVSVLLGRGDGTLQPARTIAVGRFVWSVAVGDVNGDGTGPRCGQQRFQ